VSEFHLLESEGRTIKEIPFAESGVFFMIDGKRIENNNNTITPSVFADIVYNFSIRGETTFRGGLIRVEQGDGETSAFLPA
jgi:hypothetical protein